MKKVLLLVITVAFVIPVFAASDSPSDWAAFEVNAAINAGFVPEEIQNNYTIPITRAEFAKMSVMFAMCELGYETEEFKRVLADLREPLEFSDTNDEYVVMAYQMGVIYGTGDGLFEPERSITRLEAAVMLERLFDSYGTTSSHGYFADLNVFADREKIAEWAYHEVRWCVTEGIMKGISDTLFDPEGTYTREQSIITFARLDAIEGWEKDNINARIRRKISLNDAVDEYINLSSLKEIARYDTNGYGVVLHVKKIDSLSENEFLVLIGNNGKSTLIARLPILNRWGKTASITKIEFSQYNSVVYLQARYEWDMLGKDPSYAEISEPGTYWQRINLITLQSESGYVKDSM